MRILSTGLMLTALVGLGACSNPNSMNRPTDTGSMQAPSAGGNSVTVGTPAGRDVGSMAAPSGSGGAVSTTMPMSSAPDTGNMALPPRAQGNSLPRRR